MTRKLRPMPYASLVIVRSKYLQGTSEILSPGVRISLFPKSDKFGYDSDFAVISNFPYPIEVEIPIDAFDKSIEAFETLLDIGQYTFGQFTERIAISDPTSVFGGIDAYLRKTGYGPVVLVISNIFTLSKPVEVTVDYDDIPKLIGMLQYFKDVLSGLEPTLSKEWNDEETRQLAERLRKLGRK